ncbi:MAG: DUF1385 domain-containing protein [Lachnospiraceae bacterium]|nr:DUF1385 domain-containing protein [Lachnospiraceae bacterium]
MSDKNETCLISGTKYSGIGGQAVMEGVMMRNGDKYAVAVRKPDGDIIVKKDEYAGVIKNKSLYKIPIIRGVLSFVDSLVLGLSTLNFSSDIYMEDEVKKDEELPADEVISIDDAKKKSAGEGALNAVIMVVAIVLALGLFMVLPYYISQLFAGLVKNRIVLSLIEGVIRIVIFVAYIRLISLMEDIKRVFMYHGAEHKCINCIESGRPLNVENVKNSSREHRRCGTSFLLYVMVVSIIFFAFIQTPSKILRVVLRLVLIPVIAGVSYEFIRAAGRSTSPVIRALSAPGLWMQRLTTSEPDEKMIEVGIRSVEAVFDWREYLRNNFTDGAKDESDSQ